MYKIVGIVLVFFLFIAGVSWYLAPDDLKGCEKIENHKCQKSQAIVVISGGDTRARTKEAVELYKQGWAPILVVSGAAADKTGKSNALAMKEQAEKLGVPSGRILLEERSETTKQNAQEVAKILKIHNVNDVILVTSGYHMRRSKLEFTANLAGVKVRSHPVESDRQWGSFWWLSPDGWWLAIGELVKIGVFSVGGSR